MQSIFSAPNPLLFGTGASDMTGKKLREMGCTRVLVVYDKGIKAAGVADRIIGVIRAAGLETVSFEDVMADPPDWSVEQAGRLAVEEKCDGVVGIGGGSSMDTAKAAKLLITNPPPINKYFGRTGVVTNPSVPLIVIPTTAGTGSECTPGGVITNTELGIKSNISGTGCSVSLGIIDPSLTVKLPASVTASTGMDALCHCCESYTSAMANDFAGIYAREGIRLIAKYLRRACADGNDMEAREGMSLAATLGGMAMSGPYCHFAHDIGRSLGAKFHVAHGNGCAATLPQVLEAVAPAKTEQVRYIAECFGCVLPDNASAQEIGRAAYSAVQSLMKDIKLPNMKQLGLKKEELLAAVPDEVVMQVEMELKAFGGIAPPPIPVTKETVAQIVSRAYDEN